MRISLKPAPGCFVAMASTSARASEAIPRVCAAAMKWLIGIEDIDAGQFVAVPLEDSLDGEPTHLQTEPGVFLEQVARCAAERARIGAARVGKFQGEIEEAGIFRRGKPPAGIAARCWPNPRGSSSGRGRDTS